MNLGNADMALVKRIWERFRRHSHGDSSQQWNLLQEERRKERLQIARELHDTLLQGCLSASMQLCLADNWLSADSPAKPVLQRALALMLKGIDEGRAALCGLRGPALPEGSLEKSLYHIQDDFAPNERARFRISILGETKTLEPAVQEQIFFIAREALLNALRHSKASSVEAEIEYLKRKLRVVVRDNGSGIDPKVLRSGGDSHWGLTGMRERAASIGAKLRIWSKRGGGTEVEISYAIRKRERGSA
jgi:signal transduction histidine kinase